MINFIIAILLFAMNFVSCDNPKPVKSETNIDNGFVTMQNGSFYLEGKEFFPLAVNYLVSMYTVDTNFWVGPSSGYNVNNAYNYHNKDSALSYLEADFRLIKKFGFNTIRVVGVGELKVSEKDTNLNEVICTNTKYENVPFSVTSHENMERYFKALEELFDAAETAGLKVVFLIRMRPEIPNTNKHFAELASRFKDKKSLMAYDLYNEPLYFDDKDRKKDEVYQICKRWNRIAKANAPNQLITIGLEGIREIFEWDPNILDVDFVSLHPYEYEPEQVRNEIYWYGKYITKPWIIGETAVPADNDSVSYDVQVEFAQKTLAQAINCGAKGYTWWQYKDVIWPQFHSAYMGVINAKGETEVPGTKTKVSGTPKPVTSVFEKFKGPEKTGDCQLLENYYNYSPYRKFRLRGRLVSFINSPIEGGVVLAWDQTWIHCNHSVTKPDGTFELFSNFPYYHWRVSATLYSKAEGDIDPKEAVKEPDGIPTIDIGSIRLSKVIFP